MSGGKHSGGACNKYYDDAEAIKIFEPVRVWLNKHHKNIMGDQPTNKQLAQLTASLIQFQEDFLGVSAQHERLLVRIPAKLFRDYAPGGGLCIMLAACYQYKQDQDLRRWDFAAPGKMDRNIELFLQLEKKLTDGGFVKKPSIYFSPHLDKASLKAFNAIASHYQATIVSDINDATHIIHPSIPADPAEKDNEWFRSSEVFGEQSFVHWWYYPDSYDSLLPVSEVEIDGETPEPKSVWEVQGRWLTDLKTYNEFMNEEDYEVEDADKLLSKSQKGRRRSQTAGNKGKGKELKSPKQVIEEVVEEEASVKRDSKRKSGKGDKKSQEVVEDVVEEPEPPAPTPSNKKKSGGKPSAKAMREALSQEDEEEEDVEPAPKSTRRKSRGKATESDDEWQDNESQPSVDEEAATSRKKRKRSPSPDAPTNQHTVKRDKPEPVAFALPKLPVPPPVPKVREVPQTFNANRESNRVSGTNIDISECDGAAVYPHMEEEATEDCENAQVLEEQQFHVIIPSYSTWFDARSVHEIESRSLPEFFTEGNKTSKGPELYLAYRNFMIDTYRLNPNEYLTVTACRRNLKGDVGAIIRVHAFLEQWGLINYQIRIENRPGPMGPPSTLHFNIIAETPKGFVPYLPPSSNDKKKIENRIVKIGEESAPASVEIGAFGLKTDLIASSEPLPDERPWTEEETLRLLEGIELHKDDWKKVAEHVNFSLYQGNPVRTLDDCLTAFIRLPIEDPYLRAEPPLEPRLVGSSSGTAADTGLQANNPLLTAISFLATTINPSVAVDGVRAALISLGQAQNKSETSDQVAAAVDGLPDKIRVATQACLDAAQARTKILADEEAMKIKTLTATLVELQLQKIELKLRQIDELNVYLIREYQSVEVQRKQLLSERQAFLRSKADAEKILGTSSL